MRILFRSLACVSLLSIELMLGGCGSSSNGANCGTCGIATPVLPSATYVYNLQGTSPETVVRFAAGANGTSSASLTITLPTGFSAYDLKTDSSGSLYVSGMNTSSVPQVLVYAQGATTVSRTLTLGATSVIAVDSTGQVYALAQTGVVSVYSTSATGPTATRTYTLSSAPGAIIDVALDASNNLYVDGASASTNLYEVVVYPATTGTGAVTATRTITLPGQSFGVAVDSSSNIYVSDNVFGTSTIVGSVLVYGSSSTPTRTLTPFTTVVGEIGAVKVDSTGYIFAVTATSSSTSGSNGTYSIAEFSPMQNGSSAPAALMTSTSLGVSTSYQVAIK